jgi:hypothetical protein
MVHWLEKRTLQEGPARWTIISSDEKPAIDAG